MIGKQQTDIGTVTGDRSNLRQEIVSCLVPPKKVDVNLKGISSMNTQCKEGNKNSYTTFFFPVGNFV